MKKLSKFLGVAVAIFFFLSCSSDDEPRNEDLFTKQDLIGVWSINYFWDQSDRTDEYRDYFFEFKNDETIEVSMPERGKVFGNYKVATLEIENEQEVIIDVVFSDTVDEMRNLIEQWVIQLVATDKNKIELEELESRNPPEILHFKRETT